MKISQKGLYALQAMMMLARHYNQGAIRIRDIAYEEVLPEKFLELILLELKNARIVESVRGAKGGYYLAKEPAAISVRDVMAASEHQTFEINCATHPVDDDRCNPGHTCSIRPVWYALQQRVDELLTSISLADLMKQETDVQELVGISSAS